MEWEASDANDADYENLSDEAIVDYVRGTEGSEESEEDGKEEEKILHSDAYKAFELCVDCLHQQSECELSELLVLRKLQQISHFKYLGFLKHTEVTDYFK